MVCSQLQFLIKINKLLLFRDRAGEKPIFYYFNNREFIFASEIKCLLDFIDVKINKDYFPYASLEISFGENTMFSNIYSILPGLFRNRYQQITI